jgi:hypothetical protein
MRAHPPWRRGIHVGVAFLSAGTGGCATHGAPSFVLFGAYFPEWMLLAAIGLVAGVVARVAMVGSGMAAQIPLQLLSCTAIGVTTAIVVWLVWFAP